MRHSYDEKLMAVERVLSGCPLSIVSRETGLRRQTLLLWTRQHAHGGAGALVPRSGRRRISVEEKASAVSSVLNKGVSLLSASVLHDVDERDLRRWVSAVRRDGARVLAEPGYFNRKATGMGRPPKKVPTTELEKLQMENLELRVENALLKKVKTLVEEQRARQRASGRRPSTN